MDQYKAFLQAIPQITASLKSSGIEFDETEEVMTEVNDEQEDSKKKRTVKKESRANIEETSDEEE